MTTPLRPTRAWLGLQSWAGLRWFAVTVIGETPTRYRVQCNESFRLPGGRWKQLGDVITVPKQAIRFASPDAD
ncbi:hypothetical protein SAMN00768000_3613 [Sulfobacillus thermosulfidooxidans DSM 9293]|uniref:Uncharacterized protein n=1 Tax=Sulfobacillus thermosulfidooxidans (strain DSM 9293 / VKM B-1269 / AT-1) TaxID=929705 RepID=A0A1W1WQP2_SULTA|nr:hypothetical protein [Sulfobacillus thermosulfidooxidans]SMC08043.1 hypothetical protein SAMN00768000_3613 [Sulfobacillus thermosulfidooxidans DSM 9293]